MARRTQNPRNPRYRKPYKKGTGKKLGPRKKPSPPLTRAEQTAAREARAARRRDGLKRLLTRPESKPNPPKPDLEGQATPVGASVDAECDPSSSGDELTDHMHPVFGSLLTKRELENISEIAAGLYANGLLTPVTSTRC